MVQIIPSVRRCEKLASGRDGRRNRLPHLPCCPKVCKLGGAGGFACRANFSHLLRLSGEFTGQTVSALTLGAICTHGILPIASVCGCRYAKPAANNPKCGRISPSVTIEPCLAAR